MTTSVPSSQRHKRANPCPICGGFDELPRGHGRRCSGFTNGDWCRCTREEHAGALNAEDTDGGVGYRHLLVGACRCGLTHSVRATPYAGTERQGPQEIEATYDYRDEQGELLFQVVRIVGKEFRQRRPDLNAQSGWAWRLGDVRRVLYRLPELLASTDTVHVVEGEKDVETLRKRGLTATCNPGGSGKWHFIEASAAKALSQRDVIIIADRDDVGRKHANEVASHVRRVAKSVVLLEPPEPHKDVTDLLLAGGTLEHLVSLERPKPKAVPPPTESEPPSWEDHESPSVDTRPEVKTYAIDISANIDNLDAAIAGTDAGVYQRACNLVHVVESKRAGAAIGSLIIRPLDEAALRGLVARFTKPVKWVKDEEGEGWRPTLPQVDTVLRPFLKAGQWKHLKPITAATESPVFRPDGTIMQEAGYDDATGYLYRPNATYPIVGDNPSQAQAIQALDELRHVFCDFPYATAAASLVPIAAILTLVGRAAIQGPTPAFIFNASVRGSGKTLQGDVAHAIAFGRTAPHATWPEKPEEQEKLLASFALDASPVAFFDNIKSTFGGSGLEAALTSTVVEFRVLGGNSKPRLDWVSVVLVSGNNLELTDDMVRRSLESRLVPEEENPETRTGFAHPDLVAWVLAERPRLIAAALTILRSYASHGYPDAGHGVMQSFNAWSRLIPGAIAYAGGGSLLAARPTRENVGGDEVGAVGLILRRIPDLLRPGQEGITTKAIVTAVYPAPGRNDPPDGWDDVREAIETLAPPHGQNPPQVGRIGRILSKHKDRWIGGMALRASASDGNRTWRVDTRKA